MERVLLSGFEPFGGMSHNSSWDVVEQAAETITGAEVHTVLLPVEFRRSAELFSTLRLKAAHARIAEEQIPVHSTDLPAPPPPQPTLHPRRAL